MRRKEQQVPPLRFAPDDSVYGLKRSGRDDAGEGSVLLGLRHQAGSSHGRDDSIEEAEAFGDGNIHCRQALLLRTRGWD
jgi:hypothetical protein